MTQTAEIGRIVRDALDEPTPRRDRLTPASYILEKYPREIGLSKDVAGALFERKSMLCH